MVLQSGWEEGRLIKVDLDIFVKDENVLLNLVGTITLSGFFFGTYDFGVIYCSFSE